MGKIGHVVFLLSRFSFYFFLFFFSFTFFSFFFPFALQLTAVLSSEDGIPSFISYFSPCPAKKCDGWYNYHPSQVFFLLSLAFLRSGAQPIPSAMTSPSHAIKHVRSLAVFVLFLFH